MTARRSSWRRSSHARSPHTALFSKPDMDVKPTDVMFYGILSEIDAKCAVSGDTLRASIGVIMAAERGPATKAIWPTSPISHAVGSSNQVLDKKSRSGCVDVAHDAKRGGVNDHFDATIPLGGSAACQRVADRRHIRSVRAQTIEYYSCITFRGR